MRTGAVIPEGPVRTTGDGAAVTGAAGATALAPPVADDTDDGDGVLSAGCISTTQLVAKAMSRDVSVSDVALVFTVASSDDNKAPWIPASQTTTGN